MIFKSTYISADYPYSHVTEFTWERAELATNLFPEVRLLFLTIKKIQRKIHLSETEELHQ